MATTDTTKITASEWLAVRQRVIRVVGSATSAQTKPTTISSVAEKLLEKGYIDIEAVLEEIATEKADREKAEQERLEARSGNA